MGNSKNYLGKPQWASNNTARGKESGYTSKPAARMEGTHMSGEIGGGSARKGAKAQAGKSSVISGPKNRKAGDSGY